MSTGARRSPLGVARFGPDLSGTGHAGVARAGKVEGATDLKRGGSNHAYCDDRDGLCRAGVGTCFADFGHHVTCVDKDQGKIDALLGGKMPIWEPGLDRLVAENVAGGRLAFTTDLKTAIATAEAVFIAVGTAVAARRWSCRFELRLRSGRGIGQGARSSGGGGDQVDRAVGTGDKIAACSSSMARPTAAPLPPIRIFARSAAIADFKHPDRILVGAEDDAARDALAEIYRRCSSTRRPCCSPGGAPRRAYQICRQCVPGDGRSASSTKWPICARRSTPTSRTSRAGSGSRQSHRAEIPSPRAGLWRQLLSQGHAGAASRRRGSGGRAAHHRDRGQRQRRPQGGDGPTASRRRLAAASPARRSASWG